MVNTHYTDDVVWNCAPETCIILLTGVTQINSIKREKEKKTEDKGSGDEV